MVNKVDTSSYQLGYDEGYADGQYSGYSRGWCDSAEEAHIRIAELTAEIATLEARVTVLSRRLDNECR
jgi:hypothetical protein